MSNTHTTTTRTNNQARECDGSCGGHQENLGTGCLAHLDDNTRPVSRARRAAKTTVRIPFRTVSECEGLLVAYTACMNMGLPTPNCDR